MTNASHISIMLRDGSRRWRQRVSDAGETKVMNGEEDENGIYENIINKYIIWEK